ncbi:hypothetical protein CSOJ01_10138 [Colletotrichum sojae]|uniref:Nephrocystin 3-like N-terminal domain-containing protein n=1 Tax=Colletotrichum sojae TaxID=2175907 RepID=A0A8H6J116_9PEZI|nr:hypothetical protein CSOJ01_10138 [Colletotrichum sojae]
MKHGVTRDRVAKEHDVLCFEMEAAGLMDNFPCLVIRGICDYSDSHKAKQWQNYAAATAAAYAKELLSVMPSQRRQTSIQLVKCSTQETRNKILHGLGFDRIDNRYATIEAAHDKTCEWLSKHPHYRSWLSPTDFPDHHGILWISGKPGAGKSTIMKHAFTRARRKAANNSAIISFFFNARGEDLEKTTVGMHRSLLLQLLEKLPELQVILDNITHKSLHKSWASDLTLLGDLFRRAVSLLGQHQVTCFIDALDECAEDQVRQMLKLFEDLGQCAVQNNIRLYTCFSSRHYPHIDIKYGLKLTLEDQAGHEKDMEEYVLTKLKTGRKKPDKDLVAEILQKACGVFMWIVLVVNILNKEFRRGRIFAVKKRLKEIPPELSDLFRDILIRDEENTEDLLLCIQWVLFAKRPLKPEEYYYALAAGLQPKSLGEWDPEEVTEEAMEIFVISSSKGLAEVTKSKNPTVQFIHESVRDFLLKDDGLKSLWPQLEPSVEHRSHDTLKKCCYAYTKVAISPVYWPNDDKNNKINKSNNGDESKDGSNKFPFLEYATTQLLHHADAAARGLSQSEFLQDFSSNLQRWVKFNNLVNDRTHYKPYPSLRYIFAVRGYESLIQLISLVRLDQHNTTSTNTKQEYASPLFAAFHNKNQNSMQFLLECTTEKEVNQQDHDGNTVLLLASDSGHPATVEMILHAGADANILNNNWETPLKKAVQNHRPEVVQLLLSRRIRSQPAQIGPFSAAKQTTYNPDFTFTSVAHDIEQQNSEGLTLLMYATQHHQFIIIGLLLDNGADIHVTDANNNSCSHLLLSSPAYHTQDQVITICEKLYQRGINVNHRNNVGQTPLHWAVVALLLAPAELLLTLGADINCMDNYGRTPLFTSFLRGNLEISKMLVREHAQLQLYDKGMESPIFFASTRQKPKHVKFLLDLGVDVNERNHIRETALFKACEADDLKMVKCLVQSGADINIANTNNETALFKACAVGTAEIVEYLVQNGADINVTNRDKENVLYTIKRFSYQHISILQTLIEADIDLTVTNNTGQTILHAAACWWSAEDWILYLVQQALKLGLNIDSKDRYGQTPLMRATRSVNKAFVSVLLQSGADPNVEDNEDCTPLVMAIYSLSSESQMLGTCRLLLENVADAAKVTRNGDTALAAAKRTREHEVEKLLLEWMSRKKKKRSRIK